ncbi:MAG TPA: hypothetical protein VMU92_10085 [Acidobacteriaceae bacterium]|nr:hypothetical protein [Acidobacteriaceae bacterium]
MLTIQTRDVAAKLGDPELFRQQRFVNGEWGGKGSAAVENPHNGSVLGHVPNFGTAEALEYGMVGINEGVMKG